MQFILLIYNDPLLMDELAPGQADAMMRNCLAHADELRREGALAESQMLEDVRSARAVRVRHGRLSVTDGP